MIKRQLIRFNLQPDYIEAIHSEAQKKGISHHDVMNDLIYSSLIAKDNRLSNHILRTNENLLLLLLISDERFPSIKEALEAGEKLDPLKRNLLIEKREMRKEKFASFWSQLLKEVNPEQFTQIRSQEMALAKLKRIYAIAQTHKELFV